MTNQTAHSILAKDQITGTARLVRKYKKRSRCSAARRICIVCQKAAIHPNDARYAARVCVSCAGTNAHPGCSSPGSSASCRRPSGPPVDASDSIRGHAELGSERIVVNRDVPAEFADLFKRAGDRRLGGSAAVVLRNLRKTAILRRSLTARQYESLRRLAGLVKPPRPARPRSER